LGFSCFEFPFDHLNVNEWLGLAVDDVVMDVVDHGRGWLVVTALVFSETAAETALAPTAQSPGPYTDG
jgi:hypothetical protein